MNKLFTIILFAALTVTSCEKSSCGEETFGETEFQVDKEYCITESEFFRIDQFIDSRCPIDVVCVHAGFVDVIMTFRQDDVIIVDTMHISNHAEPQVFHDLGFQNLVFNVTDVTPDTKSTESIKQTDYRLVMKIKRD